MRAEKSKTNAECHAFSVLSRMENEDDEFVGLWKQVVEFPRRRSSTPTRRTENADLTSTTESLVSVGCQQTICRRVGILALRRWKLGTTNFGLAIRELAGKSQSESVLIMNGLRKKNGENRGGDMRLSLHNHN
jgi:hypothetical protein